MPCVVRRQTARRHTPEGSIVDSHLHEALKFHWISLTHVSQSAGPYQHNTQPRNPHFATFKLYRHHIKQIQI